MIHAKRTDETSLVHISLYFFRLLQFAQVLQGSVAFGDTYHKTVPGIFNIGIFTVIFVCEQSAVVGIVPVRPTGGKQHFIGYAFQYQPYAAATL